jgi:hypothetical protein
MCKGTKKQGVCKPEHYFVSRLSKYAIIVSKYAKSAEKGVSVCRIGEI